VAPATSRCDWVAPHLERGGSSQAAGTRLPAYAVYPDQPEAEIVSLALRAVRQIAPGT
jgi:hypothetical protein